MDKISSAQQESDPATLSNELVVTAVRLVRWLKAADPEPQLTGAQASALAVIVHSGGIRPAELARLEEVQRPTIARVITSLVERGLVVRQSVDDGRGALVHATAAGISLLALGQARRCKPLALALGHLSQQERSVIADAIGTLNPIIAHAVQGVKTP